MSVPWGAQPRSVWSAQPHGHLGCPSPECAWSGQPQMIPGVPTFECSLGCPTPECLECPTSWSSGVPKPRVCLEWPTPDDPWSAHPSVSLELMIDIRHNLIYQNHRSYGRIVYLCVCIYIYISGHAGFASSTVVWAPNSESLYLPLALRRGLIRNPCKIIIAPFETTIKTA